MFNEYGRQSERDRVIALEYDSDAKTLAIEVNPIPQHGSGGFTGKAPYAEPGHSEAALRSSR